MTDPIPSPASVLADLDNLAAEQLSAVRLAAHFKVPVIDGEGLTGWVVQLQAIMVRLQALFAQQETEKAQLQEIIAKANNTVLGSYGFFLEPSFVEAIDNIKAASNRHYNEKLAADARAIALERELKELDVLADQWAVAHGGYVGNAKGVLLSLPDLDARATHAEAQLAAQDERLLNILRINHGLDEQLDAALAERDALRAQLQGGALGDCIIFHRHDNAGTCLGQRHVCETHGTSFIAPNPCPLGRGALSK